MSGGHFSDSHYALDTLAEEIERILLNEEKGERPSNDDEYQTRYFYGFSEDTLEKFRETIHTLKRASNMVHRIDYLVCSDDSEESFRRRWDEHVQKPWEETKN